MQNISQEALNQKPLKVFEGFGEPFFKKFPQKNLIKTGGETPPLQVHQQISAEILFSLPICVIMCLAKAALREGGGTA
jgi:hypothetical protein